MKTDSGFKTPILFIVFNRPAPTKESLEAIRKARPSKLFIAADGPRKDRPDEAALCEETRRIATAIDWPCEVKTLFRNENLGCKRAVRSAIAWFFENVEEGIILEDDCVPHASFFPYCRELLETYREKTNIMHISGSNFQKGHIRGNGSYYFSRYANVWGWATWRRAWAHYDAEMLSYQEFFESGALSRIWKDVRVQRYWKDIFEKTSKGLVDTWDYQWTYSIWNANGICITPNKNLITNVGFGPDATHTKDTRGALTLEAQNILPISHPSTKEIDEEADNFYNLNITPSFLRRLVRRFSTI